MKVISRMVAKMPIYKNSTRIRYEIELQQDAIMYRVIRFQYVSNKLYQCTKIAVTSNKVMAIEYYNRELLTFTSAL